MFHRSAGASDDAAPERFEQRPSRNGAGGGHEMARIRATLVAIAVVGGLASIGVAAPSVVAPAAGAAGPHRAMVVDHHLREPANVLVATLSERDLARLARARAPSGSTTNRRRASRA